jgi:hypothetical protein
LECCNLLGLLHKSYSDFTAFQEALGGLKVKALSSSPSTAKKKKKKVWGGEENSSSFPVTCSSAPMISILW